MCLAVVALHAHPRYPLVLAANRDEFHARPAEPAAWWADGFLAGRDLAAGGTWLGVTRSGRWAILTNIREPARQIPDAPSRGVLVRDLLLARGDPADASRALLRRAAPYNGFNLLAGDIAKAVWSSNRSRDVVELRPGVHGLSNALLDTAWPKLVCTRAAVAAWAASGEEDFSALWAALSDRSLAADGDLPSTGVPLEWERRLSAPFIVSDGYGTRCSTVLAIDRAGVAVFIERSYDATAGFTGEVTERFGIEPTGF